MDILNTIDRGFITEWTVWVIICVLLAAFGLAFIAAAMEEGNGGIALFGIVLIVAAVAVLLNADFSRETEVKHPLRHEVTITDGYVIDALKYDVIEQRGDIYVIEERTSAE